WGAAEAGAGLPGGVRGGNAVDAAVTTALVQGVIDPMMCGIGGSGGMLVHLADEGRQEVIEFYARAGSGVREDQWEHLFIREAGDRHGYVLQDLGDGRGDPVVGGAGTAAGPGGGCAASWHPVLG